MAHDASARPLSLSRAQCRGGRGWCSTGAPRRPHFLHRRESESAADVIACAVTFSSAPSQSHHHGSVAVSRFVQTCVTRARARARAREGADGGKQSRGGWTAVGSLAAVGPRMATEARRCDARRSGRGPVTRKLRRQYTTTTDGAPSRLDPEQAERLRLCLFPPAAITAGPCSVRWRSKSPGGKHASRCPYLLYYHVIIYSNPHARRHVTFRWPSGWLLPLRRLGASLLPIWLVAPGDRHVDYAGTANASNVDAYCQTRTSSAEARPISDIKTRKTHESTGSLDCSECRSPASIQGPKEARDASGEHTHANRVTADISTT